jgi:hypothetical protein
MTVTYRNTFRDITAFCFYHYLRSPFVLGAYGICVGLLTLIAIQAIPKEASTGQKIFAFMVVESILFALLAGIFGLSIVLSMISRRNKTFLTEHTIALHEDGFITETPYSRSEQKWTIVQKLGRNARYIFLYVSQHGAHVIPRRAFHDTAEADQFYDYCRKKLVRT